MVNLIRIELIDPAVTAVPVGDVIPDQRAPKADRPIVLRPRHQPVRRCRVAAQVLELGDTKSLVEGLPCSTAVLRPNDASVVPELDRLEVPGRDGEAVLAGMDAVGAMGGDVRQL